jgi:hypothetical protein
MSAAPESGITSRARTEPVKSTGPEDKRGLRLLLPNPRRRTGRHPYVRTISRIRFFGKEHDRTPYQCSKHDVCLNHEYLCPVKCHN